MLYLHTHKKKYLPLSLFIFFLTFTLTFIKKENQNYTSAFDSEKIQRLTFERQS